MAKKVIKIPARVNQFTAAPIGTVRKRRVAAYARVSTDHEEQLNSYEAQVDYYTNYIKGREDWEFVSVYADDGFSGTSFSRPSFERMMERIKKGEINLVIEKDFSRFGRDYIELGDYLERIFPFLGVRFISVNDGYDSEDYKGTTGGLDVVMKNIVYDFYSKDLAVKVKTAKRQKMKRGEYIGGHVPYGLRRVEGERNKVEPDPEAAKVVREIFLCAIDGMRMSDIARRLNEEGYETPGAYYRRRNWKGESGKPRESSMRQKPSGTMRLGKH